MTKKKFVYDTPVAEIGQIWQCREAHVRAIVYDIVHDGAVEAPVVKAFIYAIDLDGSGESYIANDHRYVRHQNSRGPAFYRIRHASRGQPEDMMDCLYTGCMPGVRQINFGQHRHWHLCVRDGRLRVRNDR